MLEAAREAISFIEGRTSDDLTRDRMLLLAVSGMPWGMVVGIRNRLTHVYFDLDLPIIWSTLTIDLPALIGELERVLSGEK